MQKGSLLFVYGTLRIGERADLSKQNAVEFVCEDSINGELYNLGSYPGALVKPGLFDPSHSSIKGDVFVIRDTAIVPSLDAYEGFPHLYGRLETVTAHDRIVWVYNYTHIIDDSKRILSGDWCLRSPSVPQSGTQVPNETAGA